MPLLSSAQALTREVSRRDVSAWRLDCSKAAFNVWVDDLRNFQLERDPALLCRHSIAGKLVTC